MFQLTQIFLGTARGLGSILDDPEPIARPVENRRSAPSEWLTQSSHGTAAWKINMISRRRHFLGLTVGDAVSVVTP